MAVIPRLSSIYCEPFADSSQIPTYLVSRLARQHVTVSLSGDAGDELFCGYNRYQVSNSAWNKLSKVPLPLRVLAAKGITSVAPGRWDALARFIPGATRYSQLGDKLHKGAAVMASASVDELYLGMVSQLSNPLSYVIDGFEPPTMLTRCAPKLNQLSDIERMMAFDTIGYLPDDILAKVDRAGMSVSLEGRVPYLDHRVVEFAWSLPISYKLRQGRTKWPLRQVLRRYVPNDLVERPKMGFGVPIGEWLRSPLRDWAESLLSPDRIRREGFFHPEPVGRIWSEHLSGRRNWQNSLWNILMFGSWLELNG
jgi:asparagine synthase (glutamine-hydrolysing)